MYPVLWSLEENEIGCWLPATSNAICSSRFSFPLMVTKTDKYETKTKANEEQKDAESLFTVILLRKYTRTSTINQRSPEGAGKHMYKQPYLVWLVRSSTIGTFHFFFSKDVGAFQNVDFITNAFNLSDQGKKIITQLKNISSIIYDVFPLCHVWRWHVRCSSPCTGSPRSKLV